MRIVIFFMLFFQVLSLLSKQVLIFVDHSFGMRGFVNIKKSQGKARIYNEFLRVLEERLGDPDTGFENVDVFNMDGKPVRRLKDLAKYKNLYFGRETNLIRTLNIIIYQMEKREACNLSILITDNVLSIKREGFYLSKFRTEVRAFSQRVGGLAIIGVKSEFKGLYFAEVPIPGKRIKFPVTGDKGVPGISVRPFFIYVIAKKGAGEVAVKITRAMTGYLHKILNRLKLNTDLVKSVTLLPVDNAAFLLDTKSIPGKIFSDQTSGYFFKVEKSEDRITFFKEDHLPVNDPAGILKVGFKQKGNGQIDWIIPRVKFQPFEVFVQNRKKTGPSNFVEPIKEKENRSLLRFDLYRLSREIEKGNIEIKCSFSIDYGIPGEVNSYWWDEWSTNNDTEEPHKTLYFNRWLKTIMRAVLEKNLKPSSKKEMVFEFKKYPHNLGKRNEEGSFSSSNIFIGLAFVFFLIVVYFFYRKRSS